VKKYKILMAMLVVHPNPARTENIARLAGMTGGETTKQLVSMAQGIDHYGALVRLSNDGWRIAGYMDDDTSAGGWLYLRECAANPNLQDSVRAFKDELLTGIRENGKQSKITNGVLPTCGTVATCRDPEGKAHYQNRKLSGGKK
jgi:hypothetical protein